MEEKGQSELKKIMEKVQAEDLLARFRSKEDLYRYLVQQGKNQIYTFYAILVGLFLLSMAGCKISFMRDILRDDKKALKQNEVMHMEVPNYQEISVKNLWDDAMNDSEL